MSVLFWMDKNIIPNYVPQKKISHSGFVKDKVQGISDRMLIFPLSTLHL